MLWIGGGIAVALLILGVGAMTWLAFTIRDSQRIARRNAQDAFIRARQEAMNRENDRKAVDLWKDFPNDFAPPKGDVVQGPPILLELVDGVVSVTDWLRPGDPIDPIRRTACKVYKIRLDATKRYRIDQKSPVIDS